MAVNILGLDPSLTSTGWAILRINEGDGHIRVESGTIRTDKRDDLDRRIYLIAHEIHTVARRAVPFDLVLETPFFGRDGAAAMKLGLVHGAIVFALVSFHPGLVVHRYANNTIKKAVAGHGRADKDAVRAAIVQRLRLSVPPKSHDESDALAIAFCHHMKAGRRR